MTQNRTALNIVDQSLNFQEHPLVGNKLLLGALRTDCAPRNGPSPARQDLIGSRLDEV